MNRSASNKTPLPTLLTFYNNTLPLLLSIRLNANFFFIICKLTALTLISPLWTTHH